MARIQLRQPQLLLHHAASQIPVWCFSDFLCVPPCSSQNAKFLRCTTNIVNGPGQKFSKISTGLSIPFGRHEDQGAFTDDLCCLFVFSLFVCLEPVKQPFHMFPSMFKILCQNQEFYISPSWPKVFHYAFSKLLER